METNLSQSSCEVIKDFKNLEVHSEDGTVSSQDISNAVASLKISEENEIAPVNSTENLSTSTDSSGSSAEISSSSESDEPVTKRKRKRKRKRKKKATTAYESPKPFKARYKKLKLFEPAVLPKLHIRFDDCGDPDQTSSEYNLLRPRIIKALTQNLFIGENLKDNKNGKEVSANVICKGSPIDDVYISLKPRIIKAIIV